MAEMNYDLFKITVFTNMHVGSGDISFGAVDNLVQRDVVTEIPTIHSSSLKGAVREFFEGKAVNNDLIRFVFGAEPGQTGKGGGSGNYRFFSANLLSIPVRSSIKPFFRAVSARLIRDLLSYIELFGIFLQDIDTCKIKEILGAVTPQKERPLIFQDLGSDVYIEDLQAEYQEIDMDTAAVIKQLLGDDLALFHHDDFKEICSELPVVARNHLENGESKNLWYEEVVPGQTIFYFMVASPKVDPNGYYQTFISTLTENIIQIGANATIGYGCTKMEKISV